MLVFRRDYVLHQWGPLANDEIRETLLQTKDVCHSVCERRVVLRYRHLWSWSMYGVVVPLWTGNCGHFNHQTSGKAENGVKEAASPV